MLQNVQPHEDGCSLLLKLKNPEHLAEKIAERINSPSNLDRQEETACREAWIAYKFQTMHLDYYFFEFVDGLNK